MNDTTRISQLERKLDAALTRLRAEKERCNRMHDWEREKWLEDIIKDLQKM